MSSAVNGCCGVGEHRLYQRHQEGFIGGRQVQRLERRAAGALTGLQGEIGAARGAHEDLAAAVLVEEHAFYVELFELGEREIDDDGLARTGWPVDRGMPEIADMEVEIEGAVGAGLELGNRLAPVIAIAMAGRIIVQRRERGKVPAGHQGGPQAF